MESQTRQIAVDGASLFCEVAGAGRAVVLIHSGITDSRMWDAQWVAFTSEMRVVRYDLRGFGRSTLPPAPYAHLDDLRALLEVLDIPRATVVGASFGGEVATAFALDEPERVDALVLVNTLAGMSTPSAVLRAGWDAIETLLESGDVDAAVERELQMWVDGPARSPDQVDPSFRERVREMDSALFARAAEQEEASERAIDPPLLERLHELRAPTLIVTGALDMPDALTSAAVLGERIPGATQVTIPGAAHLPSMERPNEFNRIVLDFIHEQFPVE